MTFIFRLHSVILVGTVSVTMKAVIEQMNCFVLVMELVIVEPANATPAGKDQTVLVPQLRLVKMRIWISRQGSAHNLHSFTLPVVFYFFEQENCFSKESKEECSGQGTCNCGKCDCNRHFGGEYCEKCLVSLRST